MKIVKEKNIVVDNPKTKPFLADAFYPTKEGMYPLVIFIHGYKGYKDWGAWNVMGDAIAEAGFFFVKFNFSYNGTTLEQPTGFVDLESFGNNSYSKELSDAHYALDFFLAHEKVDASHVSIIGHSRGGGIAAVLAAENDSISNLITLAGVDSLERFPEKAEFEKWKADGVFYTVNGRTKQNMPHYFQFFEDYQDNKDRLNVEKAVQNVKSKFLIIHGTNDEAVPLKSAENLKKWNPTSKLFLLPEANHTFGAREPWEEEKMPIDLQSAVHEIIQFIK